MIQNISIKDTRNRLADIVNQVEIGNDIFIVTKFGKPKAMIVPLQMVKKNTSWIKESGGAWANRTDIEDSGKWVENLRAKMSTRNE